MTAPVSAAPTEPIVLRERPDLTNVTGRAVFCSHCWDAIAHDGIIWRHIRTGLPAMWNDHQCHPLCDWPDCAKEADPQQSIGSETWMGSGFRYQARNFLCPGHWICYCREQVVIDRT